MNLKQPLDTDKLLLIFTRNPEIGKCKTRLAATIGDRTALDIYSFLLDHTVLITRNLALQKTVYYSEEIWMDDIWDNLLYHKKLQQGSDLGERMENAFSEGFSEGFRHIIIIGSDMYDLTESDLNAAFSSLKEHDFVVGPATDGGYYLLGMNALYKPVFRNKAWGQKTVLGETLGDLSNKKVHLLEPRNDVDVYEDIKHLAVFRPFLKNLNQ